MSRLSSFLEKKFYIDINNPNFEHLKFFYYVLLFNFFTTFNTWLYSGYLTRESVDNFTAVCPPYFQKCLNLYIFNAPSGGYSLGLLYAFLGAFLFLSLYFALSKKWTKAFALLLVPLVFKVSMLYLFSFLATGNYMVIEIACLLVLLFSKSKFFAFKILLSSLYFFSALIKIYPGYISGDMFNTLRFGLPLLPADFNNLYPILVISFFLFSSVLIWHKDERVRKISFLLLGIFHLYTIIMVGFRFPVICFSLLFVVMLATHEPFSFQKMVHDKVVVFIILFFITMQTIPFFIYGNSHITGEGEKYGFYIFNTNKQCISKKTYNYLDGTKSEKKYTSSSALVRCDPYEVWFIAQEECKKKKVKSISVEFNLSLDGSPYFKVINENDICLIKNYKPFRHNEWLQEGIINKDLKVYKNSI